MDRNKNKKPRLKQRKKINLSTTAIYNEILAEKGIDWLRGYSSDLESSDDALDSDEE